MPFPTQDSLAPLLTTRVIGRTLETHSVIDSTNIRAKALAAAPENNGLVVIADQQTAGRGRMTHTWQSPAGKNLYFSLVLHPVAQPQNIPQIAIVTAIALHIAFSELIPTHRFGLKWPNDIWSANSRKLSGILCEAMFCGTKAAVIAGIGINVNCTQEEFPAEISQTAGSLADIADRKLERPKVLAAILNHFEPLMDTWQREGSLTPFMDYWKQFDILKGRNIIVQCGDEVLSGTACGIQHNGMLILKDNNGVLHAIHAGDTHILNARE